VLQVSILATVALLVGQLLRRASAARYWLSCLTLALVLLCPVVAAIVQSLGIGLVSISITQNQLPDKSLAMVDADDVLAPRIDDAGSTVESGKPFKSVLAESSRTPSDMQPAGERSAEGSVALSVDSSKLAGDSAARAENNGSTPHWIWLLRRIGPPLLIIWAVGAFVLLVRLVVAWSRLLELLRSAAPNTDSRLTRTFREAWLALGSHTLEADTAIGHSKSRRMPELVFSDKVSGPVAAGVRSPKVILPESFPRRVNTQQLRDVLIHEVAHVLRGDQMIVLLQNVMGAVFWMHPLVRLLNRQLPQAREEVCDNYVLASTDAPSYSRTLLTLSQLLDSPRAMTGTVGLFTSRWKLQQRVAGLLDEQRSRVTRLSKSAFLLIGVMSLVLAVTVTFGTISIAATSVQESDKPEDAGPVTRYVLVKGVVLKPDGTFAKRATVRSAAVLYGHQRRLPDDFQTRLFETTTDGMGQFEIEIDRSPYGELDMRGTRFEDNWRDAPIAASLEGFGCDWTTYDEVAQQDQITLQLVEDVPLRGRVVDLEGQAISGLTVGLGRLSRSDSGELSDWLAAIEAGENPLMANRHVPHHVDPRIAGISNTFMTADDGSFELHGIGRERKVTLEFVGSNVAFQRAEAVTHEMPFTTRMLFAGDSEPVFGANFVFTAAPSQPVSGVVIDAETKQPLAGVAVEGNRFAGSMIVGLQTISTTTDVDGRFRLTGLPKGQPKAEKYRKQNRLMLRPTDDQPYLMRNVDVPIGQGLDEIEMTVELHRGVWIKGRVTDKTTGKPVAEVRMHYLPYRNNEFAQALPEFDGGNVDGDQMRYQTDEHGEYRLVGLRGRAVVGAVSIATPFRGGIGYDRLRIPKDAKTPDLFYRNPWVPGPSWPNAMAEISPLKGTEEVQLDLELDPGALVEVRVVDEADQWVVGAELRDFPLHTPGVILTEAKTYEARSCFEGESRWIAVLHKERGIGKVIQVESEHITQGKIRIQLEPCAVVTGQLTDDGRPLSGLTITPEILPSKGVDARLAEVTTDINGRFQCTLPPGCSYQFYAEGQGLEDSAFFAGELTIEPGKHIDLGTLKLTSDHKFVSDGAATARNDASQQKEK